jgi:hypothetical protein
MKIFNSIIELPGIRMNNNIVILDDHPMFLIGLKKVIDRDSEFTVSDCCKNSSDLFFL